MSRKETCKSSQYPTPEQIEITQRIFKATGVPKCVEQLSPEEQVKLAAASSLVGVLMHGILALIELLSGNREKARVHISAARIHRSVSMRLSEQPNQQNLDS